VKFYIAGRNGMVGRALENESKLRNFEIFGKPSSELDFRNRDLVFKEFNDVRPDILVIAAAKVGGIRANQVHPVEFLSNNLLIQTNLIDAAHNSGIAKVIFLGSSCIYPKYSKQPITEDALLTGPLEPTNEAYAIAKISGLKLIDSYRKEYNHNWISLMPTNLYGEFDNFDPETSHVIPALIQKFHEAASNNKETISIWGDGTPLRSFLHVEDLAKACLNVIAADFPLGLMNVGTSQEITISDLARKVSSLTGFQGEIRFDSTMPNGTPRKILDNTKINNLGWQPTVTLTEGLLRTYSWYKENIIRK
jgi:GDP-L-fucose synthase